MQMGVSAPRKCSKGHKWETTEVSHLRAKGAKLGAKISDSRDSQVCELKRAEDDTTIGSSTVAGIVACASKPTGAHTTEATSWRACMTTRSACTARRHTVLGSACRAHGAHAPPGSTLCWALHADHMEHMHCQAAHFAGLCMQTTWSTCIARQHTVLGSACRAHGAHAPPGSTLCWALHADHMEHMHCQAAHCAGLCMQTTWSTCIARQHTVLGSACRSHGAHSPLGSTLCWALPGARTVWCQQAAYIAGPHAACCRQAC